TAKTNKLKALIVGAGGIGTYAALNLALMGIDMDIMDGDRIESHNLNRQILYYGCIGENKAKVLSERLKEFSRAKITALPYYLKDESQIKRNEYQIILSCLDNWEWRFRLNSYAKRNKIKFINGAVSTFSAKAEFSQCLNCKYDKKTLVEEQKKQKASCANLTSNVVMPNAFAGALMASEAKATATPIYQQLTGKEIRYHSKNEDSKKITLLEGKCRC
ncbi:MAG: ThiF family adenylyltransferase, partial [archaeon]